MSDYYDGFEKRKKDHIKLALMPSNQASEHNPFDHFSLQHEALPDFNFSEIDISTQRFGKIIQKPFFVSSMTAGHNQSIELNRILIDCCSQSQWAMGIGSQRRELTDPHAATEWKILRKSYPKVTLFSNLGIAQLITTPLTQIQSLIDALEAEALIIHCNPLQEVIQPEGTPHFKGSWSALENLVKASPVPIVIKETGCGFSSTTLARLNNIGIAAVDVSGLGGTHWGRIEGARADKGSSQEKAAQTFQHWGINTIQSLKNAASVEPKFEIWGSGGVRHGLDAAKLFALGASSVGFAKPMLEAALQNIEQVHHLMNTIEYELKVALFCTGSPCITSLRGKLCH